MLVVANQSCTKPCLRRRRKRVCGSAAGAQARASSTNPSQWWWVGPGPQILAANKWYLSFRYDFALLRACYQFLDVRATPLHLASSSFSRGHAGEGVSSLLAELGTAHEKRFKVERNLPEGIRAS